MTMMIRRPLVGQTGLWDHLDLRTRIWSIRGSWVYPPLYPTWWKLVRDLKALEVLQHHPPPPGQLCKCCAEHVRKQCLHFVRSDVKSQSLPSCTMLLAVSIYECMHAC